MRTETILRENLKADEPKFLVKYKSIIDGYKRYHKVIMNEQEKDYILENKTEKNGNIEVKKLTVVKNL